jgi:hypothetical protein
VTSGNESITPVTPWSTVSDLRDKAAKRRETQISGDFLLFAGRNNTELVLVYFVTELTARNEESAGNFLKRKWWAIFL